jgi:hypothetical protein
MKPGSLVGKRALRPSRQCGAVVRGGSAVTVTVDMMRRSKSELGRNESKATPTAGQFCGLVHDFVERARDESNRVSGGGSISDSISDEGGSRAGGKRDQERLDWKSISDRRYSDGVDHGEVGDREIDRQQVEKLPTASDCTCKRTREAESEACRSHDQVWQAAVARSVRDNVPEYLELDDGSPNESCGVADDVGDRPFAKRPIAIDLPRN